MGTLTYTFGRLVNKAMRIGMYDYCQLETIDDAQTFVTQDGGLLTVLEIEGTGRMMGQRGFRATLEDLHDQLGGVLKHPGHRLQFVFVRDPHTARRVVEQSTRALRRTVRHLKLDLEQPIEERERKLSEVTAYERCFLTVRTSPSVIAKPADRKDAMKDRDERNKAAGVGVKPGEFAQSPFVVIDDLRELHRGFVRTLVSEFGKNCRLYVMEAGDALRALREQIDPDWVSSDWQPSLPGSRLRPRLVREADIEGDASHIAWPSIAYQLFSRPPRISSEDATLVELGDRYYAPLMVDVPPKSPQPFAALFEAMGLDMPWRIAIAIDTGHDNIQAQLGRRHTFASLLAFSSSQNRLIRDGANELFQAADHETLVSVSISAVTWGEDRKQVERNKSLLVQALQRWGHAEAIEERGDAIEAWCDTLPGFKDKLAATPYAETLEDALRILPITRPTSPWQRGPMLYRTLDNRLFPYQPMSAKQASWVDLVFAPPGMGKSFWLSATNAALICNPGNNALPKIANIDIGPSSAAFVDLIREALPEDQKHLAQSFKLRMSPDMAINPFDTPLGMNKPLAVDREFLVNFLSLVLTPAGAKDGIPRLADLCSLLVDQMYEYVQPEREPKLYSQYIDSEVDTAIERYDIKGIEPGETTWWEVRDKLFDEGLYHVASLAQRHAVPNLQDATTVLSRDQSIRDLYGNATFQGSENLLDFLNSTISAAIQNYRILSGPSVFDTGSARIVSIDLSEVALSGSAAADKMTAIVYMLARNILCRDYYRGEDTLREIPAKYRPYHRRLIDENAEVPKRICMDEFHRTEGAPQVRNQAEVDIREGRKYGVMISLLSQRLADFSPKMVELASNVYIFSKGITEDTFHEIVNRFAPTRDAQAALKNYVTGPKAGVGATLLYIGDLKGQNSRVEQVLRLTLGPLEMWAYSTTAEDVQLRRRLARKVGLSKALQILAVAFESGSAKDYIERRMSEEQLSGEDENLYERICEELLDEYKRPVR